MIIHLRPKMGAPTNLRQVAALAKLTLVSILAVPFLGAPSSAESQALSFGYYRGFDFSARQADEIIRGLNNLAAASSIGNVACARLSYQRTGSPSEFSGSLSKDIGSEDDVIAFRRSPFSVHIVRAIFWCKGRPSIGSIKGCG